MGPDDATQRQWTRPAADAVRICNEAHRVACRRSCGQAVGDKDRRQTCCLTEVPTWRPRAVSVRLPNRVKPTVVNNCIQRALCYAVPTIKGQHWARLRESPNAAPPALFGVLTQEGKSALMWAAQHGHASVVSLLMNRGANSEARSRVSTRATVLRSKPSRGSIWPSPAVFRRPARTGALAAVIQGGFAARLLGLCSQASRLATVIMMPRLFVSVDSRRMDARP